LDVNPTLDSSRAPHRRPQSAVAGVGLGPDTGR